MAALRLRNMNKITIIIADDHPIVRQDLRQTIETESEITIVAEAENGQLALEAIVKFAPQIAVLDIDMPEMDGFAVARAVSERNLDTEIIFLAIHQDEIMFNEAIDLGAKGFVLKQSALAEIISCIKTVAKSQHYASPSLTTFLINRQRRSLNLGEEKVTIKNLTRSKNAF